MSWLDPFNIFDPGKASRAAQGEYKKGWEQAQQYEKPYWQAGINQLGKLKGAENKLLDPMALQNEWSSGYEMSPYAKQLQGEAASQGMDAASSMGLLGSSTALSNIQQGASNIMNKDRQQYMDDLMKKYMQGIGIGQDIYGKGASMGGQLGNQAMNFGEQMGAGRYNEINAPWNMAENMMKLYMMSQGGGF